VQLESYHLNQCWFTVWPYRPNLRVVNTLLRILDHEARLMGLYAPAKAEQSGSVGSQLRFQPELDPSKLSLDETWKA